MVGDEGLSRRVNGLAKKRFGYRRDEMVGQEVEVLVPERASDTHQGHRAP